MSSKGNRGRTQPKMVGLPRRLKPWEHRKQSRTTPDPLGSVDANPPIGLSRKDLYEEDPGLDGGPRGFQTRDVNLTLEDQ
jgi:hypothetical protein